MDYKKAIYKEREVDLTATMQSLDVNEAVFLPYRPELRLNAIRCAASRQGKKDGRRYKVSDVINGTIITRVEP